MDVKKLITPIITMYIIAMIFFWFQGEGTRGWNVYYYSIEKLFASLGFAFLALESRNKYIVHMALYAVAVCLFMFMYFIYCMYFGHDSRYAVGSFLLYSIASIAVIKKMI